MISVAYHNPYMVAERAVLLDHLTRGRFMLGVGPGSLPTDAIMLGLDPTETRPLLEEGLDVIMRLLTTDEPVSSQTKMWNLTDARLHLRPYSNPLFDVAVPAVASPTGPTPRRQVRHRPAVDRRHPGGRASTRSACTGT